MPRASFDSKHVSLAGPKMILKFLPNNWGRISSKYGLRSQLLKIVNLHVSKSSALVMRLKLFFFTHGLNIWAGLFLNNARSPSCKSIFLLEAVPLWHLLSLLYYAIPTEHLPYPTTLQSISILRPLLCN